MKCTYCGLKNPKNRELCMYCNMPLYEKIKRRHSVLYGGKCNKVIIAVIAVLSIVFAGLLIYGLGGAKGRLGIGSGFGGGGGAPVQAVRTNSRDITVTLDDPDPDVEIYSFNTDTYDIAVGESKKVTFTAEIFTNIKLGDNDVRIINEKNAVLGYMNDSGVDDDAVAGDGIYTLSTYMTSGRQENIMYFASAKNIISNSVNICFYRMFTDEDISTADMIAQKLKETAQPYLGTDMAVGRDDIKTVTDGMASCLAAQKTGGVVSDYDISGSTVYITLKTGYKFIYNVGVSGYLAGGGNKIKIGSYAPDDGTNADAGDLHDEATDGAANSMGTTFAGYGFASADNFDSGEVTLEELKNISTHGVIIWAGHGGCDKRVNGSGSYVMTGEKQSNTVTASYSADIAAERVLVGYSTDDRNTYCVSGGFFDKYSGDMSGAFVYITACSSGMDMTDGTAHRYSLVDSFIKKGASAVFAYSDTVSKAYGYSMERDIINRMCEKNGDVYYTAAEALEYAKSINRETDPDTEETQVMLFPQSSANSVNFRFFNTGEGYVTGFVNNGATGVGMENALVRVYREGDEVMHVRTNSDGSYSIGLHAGDYLLKTTRGWFKGAKMAVRVTENTTVYNETLPLLDVAMDTGYAKGTITNAVSGQTVDGADIKLRSSWNNTDGAVLQTTSTDENGYYEISYTPGLYTIEYSKEDYIIGHRNIVLGDADAAEQNAAISPEMPDDGQFRIVLSWSGMPKDLDAHLTGPAADGVRFHLYYPQADANRGSLHPDQYRLDLDNTDITSRPDTPETVTIVTQLEGTYRYSVHDFTNRNASGSDELSRSNATVNVYKGNVWVAAYHVPANVQGTIWTVFEISGSQITPVNRMSIGSESDGSKF